ncbi:unnamed protein product [Trichogramma brassicae]|uniref:Uncharacterized protein n=1 Tax=Trichogramma brassicae TaxID=86971 RepID=A0A6H5I2Y8_9HYME|nr:unnamed protein product [Trichogramma brassicae]
MRIAIANRLNTHTSKLQKLTFLSSITDWRDKFYRGILMTSMVVLYREENDDLPNLLNIFHRQHIELLLCDAINRMCDNDLEKEIGEKFVELVARTGYKHEPDANRLSRTPIHYAVDKEQLWCLKNLFVMYDNCDVNYKDGAGLTHLHAACMGCGCESVVKRLLERGRADPNQVWPKTGDSPLHLCARHGRCESGKILLRNGADPNPTNRDGSTPLHIICENEDYDTAEEYFQINEECERVLLIDARDAKGRTPLQLAVAKLFPDLVQIALGQRRRSRDVRLPFRGADQRYLRVYESGIRGFVENQNVGLPDGLRRHARTKRIRIDVRGRPDDHGTVRAGGTVREAREQCRASHQLQRGVHGESENDKAQGHVALRPARAGPRRSQAAILVPGLRVPRGWRIPRSTPRVRGDLQKSYHPSSESIAKIIFFLIYENHTNLPISYAQRERNPTRAATRTYITLLKDSLCQTIWI